MMAPEQWDEMRKQYTTDDGFTSRTVKGIWFTFEGRLNRMRYFQRILPVFLLSLALSQVLSYFLWLGVFYIPLVWAQLTLITRRAHDMGFRPWALIAMSFLPPLLPGIFSIVGFLIYIITQLYLIIMKGDVGANKYGLDPLEYPSDIR